MVRPLRVAVGVLAALLAGLVLLRVAVHPVGRLLVVGLVLALALGVLAVLRREPAYPRDTVGTGRRVLSSPVGDDEDATCVECDDAAAGGRRRRFVREWVLAGVPVVVLDDGENVYCAECAPDGDATTGRTDVRATGRVESERQ
jgi:hypothetical protein